MCGAGSWRRHGEHLLRRDESGLTSYQALRRRVLFEVWCPGASEVRLRELSCGTCGMCCYAPRPDAADVEAKYRFLQEHERHIGASAGTARARALDRARADRTAQALLRHAASGRLRVLDLGGGDGKLLAPFAERGDEALLVDYNRHPVDGVRRLGDTLEEVPADERFDAAICSHVLEHVPQPLETVHELAAHLHPGAVLYVEVPLEVWRGLPIARDPVTHVNFFTPGSLRVLLQVGGLQVLESGTRRERYGGLPPRPVAYAVARTGRGAVREDFAQAVRDVDRLLRPSPWQEARRALIDRRVPRPRALLARMRRSGR